MTRDLEARLLASVPTIGHFQRLAELGVGEASFHYYSPLYRYIGEIVREHNHLPRLIDLKATFNLPDHVQRKPEEFQWLLDEFLKLTTVQRVQDIMEINVENYGEDPKELIPALIRDFTKLQIPDQRSASLTDQSAVERLTYYEKLEAQTTGFMVGTPTGIRYFDSEYRIGWLPGELNGIVGRLYIGKSWMLMYHGVVAWMFGKRVVFLSPEMTKEEAEARFDTLVCGLQDVPVDISDFYRGFKPSVAQREALTKAADKSSWITLTSDEGHPFRLAEIPRIIRQYNPDLLLIDGLLLISPEQRGKSWEQILELSYGLKNLAVGTGITILVAHQANRDAHDTARPPGLHEISMGDAFAQACDRVIALSKPTRPPDRIRLTIQKFRKGKPLQSGTDFEFLPGQGKVREDDEYPGTVDGIGDLGETVQTGKGNISILPIT